MYVPHKTKGEKFYVAINGCDAYGAYDTLEEAIKAFEKFKQWAEEDPNIFKVDFDKIKHIIKVTESGKEIVWQR